MLKEHQNQVEKSHTNKYWVQQDRKFRAQVRKTRSIELEKGKGAEVWDMDIKGEYI